MIDIQTTFEIPDWIEQGLKDGECIRVGGVIREAKTKQIVAMLREVAPNISQESNLLNQVGSISSLLNSGISILNLGVSVIGFALILKRLRKIEQQIEKQFSQVKDNINNLHLKFDISVYANFSAALNLAHDATMMLHPENRINMATLAINRFLEAQHIYSNYIDISLKENINIADKYLLLLSLTYIARVRCYLELEEIKNAVICLQEGAKFLRIRMEQYVKSLLISQPINLDSPIELSRKLAQICKWLEPELNNSSSDKSILFEAQGKNLVKIIQNKINEERLFKAVPAIAVASAIPIFGGFIAYKIAKEAGEELLQTIEEEKINSLILPIKVEKIEQIIETYNRFEAYLLEVQVIQQLGMNFQNWLQLAPHTEAQQYKVEIIYIIPSQPLNLK